jgi:hypothetical protein
VACDEIHLRVGHLAFGLAFAAIGVAWLLRPAGLDIGGAWLTAIAVLALGLAGLVTTVMRLLR